jgi:twitching motility protein PilT
MDINKLLKLVIEKDASDLHLSAGVPPVLRINGELELLGNHEKLTPQDTKEIIYSLLSEEQRKRFEVENELDFSFGVPNMSRFRINVHKQRGSVAASIRRLAMQIPHIEDLGLPKIVADMADLTRGLVLVTGPAGSGKSTTLAAFIDLINTKKAFHVITIEDPIEYIHNHNKCLIEQREVSSDTNSFAIALKHVLRQDPNVILVGEMRDLETISMTITAAETGHLVLATLHTNDAVQSIDRIIDVFPSEQQQQVRIQLSLCLQCVISQQLVPRIDRQGRVAAVEVLIANPAIRNLIREGKIPQIYSSLETGSKFGMQSMDQSLAELCHNKLINLEEALTKARDPEGLKRKFSKGDARIWQT